MREQALPQQGTQFPAAVPARIGRRLIGLVYDLFPAMALWFVIVVLFLTLHYWRLSATQGAAYAQQHAAILPGGLESFVLFCALFGITGLYATVSWHRGGQTIGMKPFRSYVVDERGEFASYRQLWVRFLAGLIALPLGFWVAYFRKDRLTLHDLISHTRFIKR